jgi:hypothetical protein
MIPAGQESSVSPLISASTRDALIDAARVLTFLGIADDKLEEALIFTANKKYNDEQNESGVSAIGQALINGLSPTALVPPGTTVPLTFQFINPGTGQPTTGPTVSLVDYMANLNPNTPNVFVDLGTSTNAASNFSLPFTVVPFEPFIKAIPFGPNGQPIVIPGVGGENVAIGVAVALQPIPEPSTLTLLGLGSLGLLGYGWRRRKQVA